MGCRTRIVAVWRGRLCRRGCVINCSPAALPSFSFSCASSHFASGSDVHTRCVRRAALTPPKGASLWPPSPTKMGRAVGLAAQRKATCPTRSTWQHESSPVAAAHAHPSTRLLVVVVVVVIVQHALLLLVATAAHRSRLDVFQRRHGRSCRARARGSWAQMRDSATAWQQKRVWMWVRLQCGCESLVASVVAAHQVLRRRAAATQTTHGRDAAQHNERRDTARDGGRV
jgi:hypothetical protein